MFFFALSIGARAYMQDVRFMYLSYDSSKSCSLCMLFMYFLPFQNFVVCHIIMLILSLHSVILNDNHPYGPYLSSDIFSTALIY